MILLSEFLNELVDGEGSQVASVVTASTGQLNPKKVNGIINILNAALTDVFTRFLLVKTEVILKTKRDLCIYKIDNDHIFHPDTNPDGYVHAAEPFKLLAITDVRTLNEGITMPLNRQNKFIKDHAAYQFTLTDGYVPARHNSHSFHTSGYSTLRTPLKLDDSELILSLRTGHPRIENIPADKLQDFDYDSVLIDLPESYRTALIYYTMSRLMNAKGAQNLGQSMFHDGDNYYRKYLQECELLKSSDTEVSEVADLQQVFRNSGFI